MYKNLLLDIDGVLIRDRRLMSHVKSNCIKYVNNKLPCCKNPEATNHALYIATGHTGYGLSKILDVDTSDFEYKVYDKSLMEHLHEVISYPGFQYDCEQIHSLTRDGWNITLFTNAPPVWATPVALAIGDNVKIKCPTANHQYKPQASAYSDFPHNQPKIFVDDSIKNLETIRWNKSWVPLHFGGQEPSWCKSVQRIQDIYDYVKKYDEENFLLF
jgi:hypothetical protein